VTGRLLPYGPRAWLIEDDDPAGLAVAVRAAARPDVADVVPGAATTLVTVGAGGDAATVGAWLTDLLQKLPRAGRADDAGPQIEIPVVYDGEDLERVADACQLTVREVIERHEGATYRCSFCGFAPGFGYLAGLDPRLQLPRRASPRPRIPAGSVAIASGYTAVYPSASPGGWHLIGRSDAILWQTDRDPPALITPGATVRFVDRGR
jgi:KipI family sensor histidine kinase inhibitor